MTTDELALELWSGDLYSPTDITTGNVSYWLRINVGTLNNITNNSFLAISSGAGSIVQSGNAAMTEDEKVIFKKMYLVHYWDKQLRTTIGAAGTDTALEIDDGGARIRRVNKSELSKVYIQARKEEQMTLDKLVGQYKIAKAVPLQVASDDDIAGVYTPYGPEYRRETD